MRIGREKGDQKLGSWAESDSSVDFSLSSTTRAVKEKVVNATLEVLGK